MTVFTILNHGTAFDRTKEGELIAELGRVIGGNEARVDIHGGEPTFVNGNYVINEGPGSAIATRPGAVNPFTQEPRKTGYTLTHRGPLSGSGFKQDFRGDTEYATKGGGILLGSGWDDNIQKTLFILSNKLDDFPDTINMIGWSRGAVMCLRLASAIQAKIADGLFTPVSMNLFVIDPVVGGPTHRGMDMDHIAPLIDRMIAILAMHSEMVGFSPLSADKMYKHREADSQDIVYLPMPGVHSGQVQRGPKFAEAADITWNLAYKFLSSLGTPIPTKPQGMTQLNNAPAMCDAYARLILSGAKSLPMFNRRNFAKHLDRYVSDHDYFINKHHQLVFEDAFPDVYNGIFRAGGAVPASSLVNMESFHPNISRSLEKARVLKNGKINRPSKAKGDAYSFGWPRGVPLY